MTIRVIRTEDGSDSLFDSELQEIYHSKNGAVAESRHVFVNAGYSSISSDFEEINLLEIGFGTGLNALLTSIVCETDKRKVNYFTYEPYEIEPSVLHQLNHGSLFDSTGENYFNKIHNLEWNKLQSVHSYFQLKKIKQKIESSLLDQDFFHLVYFDAFAPQIQPELWTLDIFQKVYDAMVKGGVLVTYSAKGEVRRNLQSAGFKVFRLEGPKGKREMIRAVK